LPKEKGKNSIIRREIQIFSAWRQLFDCGGELRISTRAAPLRREGNARSIRVRVDWMKPFPPFANATPPMHRLQLILNLDAAVTKE
jgi:hypothetical protein